MAINRFNTPAEQNLMQTYVPLPFQEMAAAAQMIQGRHDTGEALAESLDDNLMNIKANRELDKRFLKDYTTNLDNELSNLIKKHDGRYADMVPDLKLIKKRIDRDLASGDLASIKSSGEQLAKYTEGVLETKKAEKYNPYHDAMLGAGAERGAWMQEGMKNVGTETQPNWVLDEDYYQNTVVGQPLSSYKYTRVWQSSNMLKQLDKIYGKVKPDSQEITYDTIDNQGNKITVTDKIDQITPGKIAQAALNNKESLSANALQELNLWSHSLTDQAVYGYARSFIQTLLSDEMLNINENDPNAQEQVDAINQRYTTFMNTLQNEQGLTPEAHNFAQMWNIYEEGQKYIHGDVTHKSAIDQASDKYNANGINQTHKYKIADTGLGPELQITPVVDEFGEDIIENSEDKLYTTWQDAVRTDYSTYNDAVDEYLKWKNDTPGDVEHLDDLLRQVNAARYDYESGAFTAQLMAQQAAINANYRYRGKGGTFDEPNEDGYYLGDITYGANNDLLPGSYNVGYGDSGDHAPMRHNIDVLFGEDGYPLDPSNVNEIFKHVQSRTMYDSDGNPTGFVPTYTDYLDIDPIYITDPDDPNYGELDPLYTDYTQRYAKTYDASYYGDTPLDKAKVKLYEKNKKTLFGGRTRQITELSGVGDRQIDKEIASSIVEKWIHPDIVFETSMDAEKYSMSPEPGTGITALEDEIADLNGDGLEDQDDVLELIDQIKKGDKKILWEASPNSRINNGSGGYRGVVKVPTADGKTLSLYFPAPQTYVNEIMSNGMDANGFYGPLSDNGKQLKWMNYYAQIDLDRATRQPGNIVPTAAMDENGNPIGYYYFGINPNDGTALRSDEYMFVPNKNIITSIDVDDDKESATYGEVLETRATGDVSGALDVDDNTRDLARIIMLNDPNQQATKDYWYSKLDIPVAQKESDVHIAFETEKEKKERLEKKNKTDNALITGDINLDEVKDEDIIVDDPYEGMTQEEYLEKYFPDSYDPDEYGGGEGEGEDRDREIEKLITLDSIPINKEAFKQNITTAQERMDLLIENRESIINPDDLTLPEVGAQDDLALNYFDGTGITEGGTGFVGPGALVITQPGDDIFPQGAIMSEDYRVWNLTTGQELDREGKVIGPRVYDNYYYQGDDGKVHHVDFTKLKETELDKAPKEEHNLDIDGNIINEKNDTIINEDADKTEEVLPGSGAPNTISPGPQTYNTEVTLKNGNVVKGTFSIKKGQIWFDDSNNQYVPWAMHRGDGNIIREEMQVKTQLLDQISLAHDKINDDLTDVFAGLYSSMGGGAFKTSAMKHQTAKILNWVDSEGNVFDYKGSGYHIDSRDAYDALDDQEGHEGQDHQAFMNDRFAGELPEGYQWFDLTLQYSDNYDPKIHNIDGSLREAASKDKKQILNGDFPSLELIGGEIMTLSDGTEADLKTLLELGKVGIMTKTGIYDPFKSGYESEAEGDIFNIPMSDVWRSYESQKRAYEKYQQEGGSPVAPPGTSFHEAGQAFDVSQKDYDYGFYLVDLTAKGGGTSNVSLGNNQFKNVKMFGTDGDVPAILLDDIVHGGIRPWKNMDNEIQKLVVQRLIDLNKKDGYSLAQLSAAKEKNNEWWHFSIGEMTNYRESLMPGNVYGTYKYVR